MVGEDVSEKIAMAANKAVAAAITLKRKAVAKTKGRETKGRRDIAEVGGRMSESGRKLNTDD